MGPSRAAAELLLLKLGSFTSQACRPGSCSAQWERLPAFLPVRAPFWVPLPRMLLQRSTKTTTMIKKGLRLDCAALAVTPFCLPACLPAPLLFASLAVCCCRG